MASTIDRTQGLPREQTVPHPGKWAEQVCPSWCFTVFDVAARLKISTRHVRRLIQKYDIPAGLLTRPVRLANGRIVWRKLNTLTPTALEALLLAHSGLRPKPDIQRRTT